MGLPLVQGLGLRKHLRTQGRFRDPFKKVRPEERPSQTVEGWRTFLAHPPHPTSGSSSVWEMTGLTRLGQSQLRSPKQRGSTQSLSSQSGQTMVLPAWGGRWTGCGRFVDRLWDFMRGSQVSASQIPSVFVYSFTITYKKATTGSCKRGD